jgi:hypothetical protein
VLAGLLLGSCTAATTKTEPAADVPRVRLAHILIRVPDGGPTADATARSRAEAILRRAQGGADFGQLAREVSEDPATASRDGDMGLVTLEELLPELGRVVAGLRPGAVAGPVRTPLGYHVLTVLARSEDRPPSPELPRAAPAGQTPPAQTRSRIAEDTRVGDLGGPARLVFGGVQAFSPEAVKRGLLMNPDFFLASHPFAPLKEYLEAIRLQTQIGYQHNGFPLAVVSVRLEVEAGRIRVSVVEGPRYAAGEVRLVGGQTIPRDVLVRRLTEAHCSRSRSPAATYSS